MGRVKGKGMGRMSIKWVTKSPDTHLSAGASADRPHHDGLALLLDLEAIVILLGVDLRRKVIC